MDDDMHGQGRFTFASGASYQGCFEHNKFSGEGNYTFPDGKQYQVRACRKGQAQVWVLPGSAAVPARLTAPGMLAAAVCLPHAA